MSKRKVLVAGCGILGLWQAVTLARAGHTVRLVDSAPVLWQAAASAHAGAMLAPDCEAEAAPPLVRDLGREGLRLWRTVYPHLVNAGSLVLALPRDRAELLRFSRMTSGFELIDDERIAVLEPDLGKRFGQGLYFPDEAHMATPHALAFLLDAARNAGAEVHLGVTLSAAQAADPDPQVIVVDCRGLAARGELSSLRGVRGERLLVRTSEIALSRPVRLLHPRHPLYVVPWGDGRFLVGATVIESEDASAASVRSMLELLGTAYALHPAFGEAEVIEVGAGVRPAFPDNVPRVVVHGDGRYLHVNGAYRHGFLLGPVLADAVARLLADPSAEHALVVRR